MITIRECTEADLYQIVTLSNSWAQENVTIGYENVSWTEDKLRSRLNGYFFVAETDQRIIGYSFGEVREKNALPIFTHEERFFEIFEVYVDPDFRSQGVGTQLVERLISKCSDNNITRILVGSSNKQWEDTIRFYENQGFKMWYVQMYK